MAQSNTQSKWKKEWTAPAVIVAIIVGIVIVYGVWDQFKANRAHEASGLSAPAPIPQPVSISQTTTSGGAGAATSNAATGQGSQAGIGNKIGSDNTSATISGAGLGSLPAGSTITETISQKIVYQKIVRTYRVAPKMKPGNALTPQQLQANFFFNTGVDDLQKGSLSVAIQQNTAAISLTPTSAAAYNNRAIGRYILGDYLVAVSDWKEAVRLDPMNIDYRTNLINGLAALTNYSGPQRAFLSEAPSPQQQALIDEQEFQTKEMIRLHPESSIGYIALTGIDEYKGDLTRMQADIEQVAAHNPEPGQVDSLRGYLSAERGNVADAIRYYKSATQQKPDFPHVYLQWAAAENSIGHTSQALSLLKKAVQLSPPMRVVLQNRRVWGKLADEPAFKKLEEGGTEP